MNIKGYAYTKEEAEVQKSRLAHIESIAEYLPMMSVSRSPEYGKTTFKGSLNGCPLTEIDVALLVCGTMPFGGYCDFSNGRFSGAKYVD